MCQNTKFNIYFEHVVDEVNKLEVTDFLVVKPRLQNVDGISGVAILPISGHLVGLIEMYRPPIRGWSWEIPHGFIDLGETELEAAKRELLEETGLTALSISSLGVVAPDAGVIDGWVKIFACVVVNTISPRNLKLEVGLGALTWVDFKNFEQMIRKSEIQDSLTISAWCKYKMKMNNDE